MTYNEVIKQLESIGIEIDYSKIKVQDLDSVCPDEKAFEEELRASKK